LDVVPVSALDAELVSALDVVQGEELVSVLDVAQDEVVVSVPDEV
jgi:hypothetical protein